MKNFTITIFLIILFGFTSIHVKYKENQVLSNDSLEHELLNLKNQAFCDCFFKATRNAKTKISPPDGSNYIQTSELVVKYCRDTNLENIVEKWNKKIYSSNSPKNRLYMMRCLDFYNSNELKLFIDSIRRIELKK